MNHVSQQGHYTGDETAGLEIWTGGLNFYKHGFFALRLAPVQKGYYVVNGPSAVKTPGIFYSHYPAGPDILQGLMFHMGLHTPRSHKILAMGVSMAGAILAYFGLQAWFSPAASLWGVAALVLTPAFLFFNNSRYKAPWIYLLEGLLLYLVALVVRRAQRLSRRGYAGLWIGFFSLALLASWISLDDIPEFMAPGLALPFLFPRGQRLRRGLPLMLALPLGEFAGFVLHMARNTWLFGSWAAAFQDMFMIFMRRTGHGGTSYDFAKHAVKAMLGWQWFYTWPLLILATVGWARKIRDSQRHRRAALIALAGGTALAMVLWQIVMREHGMIHASTYCHGDMFAALGVAAFFDSPGRRQGRLRVVGLACMAYLLAHSVFAVSGVEGTAVKRAMVHKLLPEPHQRVSWACRERVNIKDSIEREGAKALVDALGPEPCQMGEVPRFRGALASLVLYWR